ncbi:glutamate receptor ionotropic, kainate 5-like [Portunus trituberculatus]|uniref:glutamate receptor ionotropic, kainate 5-like n=1 Tax=Portunus trituberculatus TaxID=210409 RepID=UPI001E1CB435|nr:glutamate receptor ionotropic, kainate 5-like [Portunus trituberculatus]
MNASRKTTFLRVAVDQWGTWVRVKEDQWGVVHIEGPMSYLLEILADKLAFNYELVRPEDHLWGTPLPDGNWSGMLGMLQRQASFFPTH